MDENFRVECDCAGTCGALVFHYISDDYEECIEVSAWTHGAGNARGWGNRLRHIWRIITRGTPYADFIVMRMADARSLAEWITTRATQQE